ncbi:hypothetical protein QE435_000827 [Rhizobium sp. SORGH_AS 787]|nr:hypothetical protein [Rhizobium sp. SORGH_AS_0787]
MYGLFVMSILFNNFFVLFIQACILGAGMAVRRLLFQSSRGRVKAVETIA